MISQKPFFLIWLLSWPLGNNRGSIYAIIVPTPISSHSHQPQLCTKKTNVCVTLCVCVCVCSYPVIFGGLLFWYSTSSTVHTAPFTFSTRTKHLCRLRLWRTAFWEKGEREKRESFNMTEDQSTSMGILFRFIIQYLNWFYCHILFYFIATFPPQLFCTEILLILPYIGMIFHDLKSCPWKVTKHQLKLLFLFLYLKLFPSWR